MIGAKAKIWSGSWSSTVEEENPGPGILIMASSTSPLLKKVAALQEELRSRDPSQLAFQTGTQFDPARDGHGAFIFPYWGNQVILSRQDYLPRSGEEEEPLPVIHQAVIAYYFHASKGSPPSEGWIGFSELPDGQFYTAAFQGYTGKKILQTFGNRYTAFKEKCRGLCGEEIEFADGAFCFQVLPKAAVLAVCWQGDEEFPPSYQILFADNIHYHLPTDGCAILGSMLTGRLIAAC